MSSETKYLVMEELIGVPAAAIEKAEEQASRIIQIVHGGWTKEEIDRCSLPEDLLDSHLEPTAYELLPPCQERHPEFRPKHTTKPTKESLKLTDKIVALRAKGLHWHQIAAKVGLSKEAARKRYRSWEEKQKENDLPPLKSLIKKIEPLLYEPGAEEAAAEAKHAEATIRKSRIVEEHQQSASKTLSDTLLKSVQDHPPADSQITNIIKLYAAADSNIVDNEIKQLLDRKFPGHGFTTADIRARRQKAC